MNNKVNLAKQTQEGLEEWAAGAAHSSRWMVFYKALLEIQAEVEDKLELPAIVTNQSEIDRRLRAGQLLVSSNEFAYDPQLVNQTFKRLVSLFSSFPEILGTPLDRISTNDFILPDHWISNWFDIKELEEPVIDDKAETFSTKTILNQALRPFLIGYGQAYSGRFNQELWQRHNCPVCGGQPDFSYLEKTIGARYLQCSRCASSWLFRRLECPYCENREHRSLSFLTNENELYRLYFCDVCHCYLKCIDLRKSPKDVLIPVQTLTTVALDRIAHEKGYHPGG